jgi:beta propeller repeat protein
MKPKLMLGAVALCCAGNAAIAVQMQIAPIYTPSIAVIPLVNNGKILVQDFLQGTYHLESIDASSTSPAVSIRNNLQSYLHPLDFGGPQVAWISYGAHAAAPGGGIPIAPRKTAASSIAPLLGGSARYEISVFSLGTSAEQNVSTDTGYKEFIGADGSAVVWTDYRYFSAADTTVEIFYWNAGGSERRITNHRGYKSAVRLRGNLIVWQDYRNAGSIKNADIYLYDLSTSAEKAICTNPAYQDQPFAQGRYVVWQDYRNAGSDPKNSDIYLYDLSTNQERPICTAPGYQSDPQVYGDIVVWHDYRNAQTDSSNADIYLFDLSTNTEQAVTSKAGYQAQPYLYNGLLAWYDYSDRKVYAAKLPTGIAENGVPLFHSREARGVPRLSIAVAQSQGDIGYSILGQLLPEQVRGIAQHSSCTMRVNLP